MRAVVLVLLLTITSASWADDATVGPVPTGSTIQRPGEESVLVDAPRWLVTRSMLDRAIAQADVARALEKRLEACLTKDRAKPWKSALKWGAVGVAVAFSFFLGTLVP